MQRAQDPGPGPGRRGWRPCLWRAMAALAAGYLCVFMVLSVYGTSEELVQDARPPRRGVRVGEQAELDSLGCPPGRRLEYDLPAPPTEPVDLWEWASFANSRPTILNEDLFGRLGEAPVGRVIAVQVHRGPYDSLRAQLRTLARVHGVDSALLVLSHDHVDEDALTVARGLCFSRVVRVFFPWSMQIWPDQFPGDECSASAAPCQRNASAAAAKHHWWWLQNFLSTDIFHLANYSGQAVFVEDGAALPRDALRALDGLQARHPGADVLLLGQQAPRGRRPATAALATAGPSPWARLARAKELFCAHNDTDWLRGLQASLGASGGQCVAQGHHGADGEDRVGCSSRVWPRARGGWEDPRDRQLCLDNANTSLALLYGQHVVHPK